MIYNIYFDRYSCDFRIKRTSQLGFDEKLLTFKQSLRLIKLMYAKFEPSIKIKSPLNLTYDFFHWLISRSFLCSPVLFPHVKSIDFNVDGHLLFYLNEICNSISLSDNLTF